MEQFELCRQEEANAFAFHVPDSFEQYEKNHLLSFFDHSNIKIKIG